jgi:formylmethanofuran dehydrogenase subunit E-like metal-binding protein
MKIGPVGAELFHTDVRTDGETDMTKLIVAFRNIANAPKIGRTRQDTDSNTIRCMCFACWITKARNTPLEYVTLTAFLWQHWVRERAPMLSYIYISCLVRDST